MKIRGDAKGVGVIATPPPPHDFLFLLVCQLRGQSNTLMIIRPYPDYNFATKFFKEKNVSESPHSALSKFCFSGLAQHRGILPTLTKHPATAPAETYIIICLPWWLIHMRIHEMTMSRININLIYCISCYFREGFIFANFASQTLAKISTSIHVYL